MQMWESTYTWWLKTMGPDKIIQGEKRVEGKSQRILKIEGHVQGKGVHRNQQKIVIREI